jgi:hypothetical protein
MSSLNMWDLNMIFQKKILLLCDSKTNSFNLKTLLKSNK